MDIKNKGCGCPNCINKAFVTETSMNNYGQQFRWHVKSGYAKGSKGKSVFMCDYCKNEWKARFYDLKSKEIGCPKCGAKYLYNNISFDSSWELIFYLYHLKLGSNIIRLEGLQKEHSFEYEFEGKKHLWYPDFLIDGVYYEIKPLKGYKGIDLAKNEAKASAINQNVRWIRNAEIKEMKKIVGKVSQYRQRKVK